MEDDSFYQEIDNSLLSLQKIRNTLVPPVSLDEPEETFRLMEFLIIRWRNLQYKLEDQSVSTFRA